MKLTDNVKLVLLLARLFGCFSHYIATHNAKILDADFSLGQEYDGIGAISGGGATSKLLSSYERQFLKEILEYLFKPGVGASLNLLKVEIGGDSQSTEGTEASHKRSKRDLNCTRGYEGWLINEVKKINPNVKIYGLPWAFPGWISRNKDPYDESANTAWYICEWITCMKYTWGVNVDYIGIWNEKHLDHKYLWKLRLMLDINGFKSTKIVGADNTWDIVDNIEKNPKLKDLLHVIGAHYPGTNSPKEARYPGIKLWSAEDYSTFNNEIGSGCLARILNQNYVRGHMTSTIIWNLVASYYNGLPFPRCSLMTANEPWSGHYVVNGPVWIVAHTTQFASPGWHYLEHETGVDFLPFGGSFVTLISPDDQEITIIIETMTHEHSQCIRPPLPKYEIKPQNVTFIFLGAILSKFEELHMWKTQLRFENGQKSDYFQYNGKIPISSHILTLELGLDQLITLTSVDRNKVSKFNKPPPSRPFPLPYKTEFIPTSPFNLSEPEYLTPQIGYFEIVPTDLTSSGFMLQQKVLEQPIDWCPIGHKPITLMGNSSLWKNVLVEVSVYLPSNSSVNSIFVAGRVSHGGCDIPTAVGIFAWLDFSEQKFKYTTKLDGSHVKYSQSVQLNRNNWYKLRLAMVNQEISIELDGKLIKYMSTTIGNPGFVGFGTDAYGIANFANFLVDYAQ